MYYTISGEESFCTTIVTVNSQGTLYEHKVSQLHKEFVNILCSKAVTRSHTPDGHTYMTDGNTTTLATTVVQLQGVRQWLWEPAVGGVGTPGGVQGPAGSMECGATVELHTRGVIVWLPAG